MLNHARNYFKKTRIWWIKPQKQHKNCLNYQIKNVNLNVGKSAREMTKRNSSHCIIETRAQKPVDRKQRRTHNNGQIKTVNFPAVNLSISIFCRSLHLSFTAPDASQWVLWMYVRSQFVFLCLFLYFIL